MNIFDFIFTAYETINHFVHSPAGAQTLFGIKVASAIISLTLLLGIIYIISHAELIQYNAKKVRQFLDAKPIKTVKK